MLPTHEAPEETKQTKTTPLHFAGTPVPDGSYPRLPHHKVRLFGVAFICITSLTLGFFGGWLGTKTNNDGFDSSHATQKEVVLSEGQLISKIAKTVSPSVVSVNVTSRQSSLFGLSQTGDQQSAGTGIIIAADGLIITNRHVVPDGTTNVSVTLSDGTEYNNVQVLGRTSSGDSLDIAFLKITDTKNKKLIPAKLGDSSKVQVGDRVVAIGNALGQFQNTVTSGIISGHGRTVQASDQGNISSNSENLEDLFQTDAAINEGNSGGPLVNTDGEVIGINTAVAGDAQDIGFAIPINDVSGLIKNVLATGKFQRPYLGVRYLSLTNDYAQQLGLNVTRGAYVIPASQDDGQSGVVSGSPADKAGIKEGDIIIAVGGVAIDDNHSLTALLGRHAVGDTIDLTILRNGKQNIVHAQLTNATNS